jgi:hypothetical protein
MKSESDDSRNEKLWCTGIRETPIRDKICRVKKNEEGWDLAARLACERETQGGEETDPQRTEHGDRHACLGAHAARIGNQKSLACSGKEISNDRMDSTA